MLLSYTIKSVLCFLNVVVVEEGRIYAGVSILEVFTYAA